MSTVLYINHGKGEHCGVYDFGVRHFEGIRQDTTNSYHYAEPADAAEFAAEYDRVKPDAVFINYMSFLLPWVSPAIRAYPAKYFVVQHLYDPGSISSIMNSYGSMFDYMICLDPSLVPGDQRIFPCGRPLQQFTVARNPLPTDDTPVQIGSFGFGMPHKQFHLIAREVNRCFDHAVYNLHMTVGDFTGDYSAGIIESVQAELTKPGVTLNWTSDYKSEWAIIDMLSHNHMNALFYALPPDNAGLSSAADYAMSAQRPLLVTDCASFKHVYDGTFQYPLVSFDTIAGNYEWCQNHAYSLYERNVGRLAEDTRKMLERTC